MSLVNDTRIMLLRSLLICEKKKPAKEKEEKEAERALLKIEAKAKRSYQKDVANLKEAKDSRVFEVDDDELEKWQYNSTSGYYYNQSNGFYYDTNAGFYHSDSIGKWVTQEEAYANPQFLANAVYKKNHFENASVNLRCRISYRKQRC